MKEKLLKYFSVLAVVTVENENWENIIDNPWTTATDPFITQLFGGVEGLFYSFLMAVTVTVAYVKTDSLAGPVGTFLIMGALLSGLVAGFGFYYFLAATAVAIGLTLYMLVK